MQQLSMIFFDVDGVLADFVAGVCSTLNVDERAVRARMTAGSDLWSIVGMRASTFLDQVDSDFWVGLPPIQEGIDAYRLARKQGIAAVLTSPPKTNAGYAGKQAWCARHLREPRPLMVDEKWLLAAPDRLLVDDNENQTAPFKRAGGQTLLWPRTGNDSDLLGATRSHARDFVANALRR